MKLILRQIALEPDIPKQYAIEKAKEKLRISGIKPDSAHICRISVDSRKKKRYDN